MDVHEFRELWQGPHGKKNKYRVSNVSERTWRGDWHWEREIVFHSKGEMHRFCELLILEKNGTIKGLQTQPRYLITPAHDMTDGTRAKSEYYIGDFFYYEKDQNGTWQPICEDYKGYRTQEYIKKSKKAKSMHPRVQFREL